MIRDFLPHRFHIKRWVEEVCRIEKHFINVKKIEGKLREVT